jgi:hypothetical protein
MVQDRLGNELAVGDTIVYGRGRGDIGIGVITHILEKEYLDHWRTGRTFYKIKMLVNDRSITIDATPRHFVKVVTND